MLGLRNLDLFNKRVWLVLTHTIEYSLADTTQIQHANTNCHPLLLYIVTITTQNSNFILGLIIEYAKVLRNGCV